MKIFKKLINLCPCFLSDNNNYTKLQDMTKSRITLELIDIDKNIDFCKEIKQNSEPSSLYLFPDNLYDHKTSMPGIGIDNIRQFNKQGFVYSGYNKPRSLGIIVSSYCMIGYTHLTPTLKKMIDRNVKEIFFLNNQFKYNKIKIITKNSYIDVGLLDVSKEILEYIMNRIKQLLKQMNKERVIH